MNAHGSHRFDQLDQLQRSCIGLESFAVSTSARPQVKDIVEDAVRFAEESSGPSVASAGDSTFAPSYKAGGFDPLTDAQLAAYAQALKEELDREERRSKGDRTAPPPLENNPNPPIVID